MDLYIYNEQVELVGVFDSWISLIWIERYRSAGSFEIYAPATVNAVEVLKPRMYVYRPDCKTAMYIDTIEEKYDADNGHCIFVRGYSIEGIMRKRVLQSTSKSQAMLTTIRDILSASPIPCLEITDSEYDVSFKITEGMRGYTLEELLRYGCTQNGMDISYSITLIPDENKLKLELYDGKDITEDMAFSEKHGTIANTVYSYSEEGCANLIICQCGPIASEVECEYPLPSYTLGTAEGLERTECLVIVDPIISIGYRLVGDSMVEYKYLNVKETLEDMKEAAAAEYQKYTENFEADALTDGYRQMWDVGDVAAVQNYINNSIYYKRIEQVQETFDINGTKIEPVFGEPLKTLRDLI